MSGWDEKGVFVSDQHLQQEADEVDPDVVQRRTLLTQAQSKFRQFLRTYRVEQSFIYRERLQANYQQNQYFVQVDLSDLEKFDNELLELLRKVPSEVIPVFEEAAKEIVALSLVPRPNLADMPAIQVQLINFPRFTEIRNLDAKHVSNLVCVKGIVVSASKPRVKATSLTLQCRNCRRTRRVPCSQGFGGVRMPRTCDYNNGGNPPKCPVDPYSILSDSSSYVDQQRLKLQENPETVPTGEMPRHISLALDRYLVAAVKPGTRVSVIGVFAIFDSKGNKDQSGGAVAIRQPYVRVLGMTADTDAADMIGARFTPEEEDAFLAMSRSDNVYDKIARSIAPAIYGSEDIKKAIACMLFGGSRKHLPDGMRIRGDINVLMLGDPSTAKSQFLKFAVQVAPIGVYTSGKGSSAAGLTASVIRDPSTGEFQLEGGALVLADGGLVCIDEFDKMRQQDRVAIHEAMEQQTISIAKAGITTILNSRASVLAAANPVFGRYDDMKSPSANIDFQSTILSRFDLIFIVRDVRNNERDMMLAKHVINVHQKGDAAFADEAVAEFDGDKLKRYIAYARSKISPRLGEEAAEALQSFYVTVRDTMKKREKQYGVSAIPITVRQLEAIVRISESLAKMELSSVVTPDHVEEAKRLFQVSTYQAATASYGGEGIGAEFIEKVKKCEKYIRRRLPIGFRTSEMSLVKEMADSFSESAVLKALDIMQQRGEITYTQQRKVITRNK